MRSRLFLSLVGAVALLAASAAQAGTLTAATWTQTSQGFPMTITGPGVPPLLAISGTSTGTSIAVALDYPDVATMFFVPKTFNGLLDLAITITQGGPQNLTATSGGMANATTGVKGNVTVMTAVHNTAGASQSTYMVGLATLVKVPVNVGISSTVVGMLAPLGVAHNISVVFYAWTTGTVTVVSTLTSMQMSITPMGQFITMVNLTMTPTPTNMLVAMGSFNLTSMGAGTVTLVAPTVVMIDCGLAQRRTASFTSLKMYFVPEPGTLLLLGAGALGLVLLGSRKR